MMIEFPFGAWLPDATDYRNPGLEECRNAIPGPEGYQPSRGMGVVVADVGASALSARAFTRADGTRVTVCATATDLHVAIGPTVTDSGLSLTLTRPIVFERFGASIYATDKVAGTWRLADIESDTAFVAAGWTIPSGSALFRVGDFLFMGDLTDTDTSAAPYRIRWSPFNNPGGAWATSIALQSDAVDLPSDFGPVMGGVGWNFGVVFQRYGITRIQYTGGPGVFAKEEVDLARGCASTASIVAVGERAFFLSDDGFFMTDGGPATPISRGRVWAWFLSNVGQSHFERVAGAVDWPRRCVVWTVPDASGTVARILHYNWETEQWSWSEIMVDTLFSSGRDGVTMDDLGSLYPDLDAMDVSLDSSSLQARGRALAAVKSGEIGLLDGPTLAASFTSGEFQITAGRRTRIRSVTPLVINPGDTTTASVGKRDRQTATVVTTPEFKIGPLGFAALMADARYVRVNVAVPENTDWADAYGFQIDASPSGAV